MHGCQIWNLFCSITNWPHLTYFSTNYFHYYLNLTTVATTKVIQQWMHGNWKGWMRILLDQLTSPSLFLTNRPHLTRFFHHEVLGGEVHHLGHGILDEQHRLELYRPASNTPILSSRVWLLLTLDLDAAAWLHWKGYTRSRALCCGSIGRR